jgi:endonuclease/exonuclease/phosphatase family metal-dependent hydrolase
MLRRYVSLCLLFGSFQAAALASQGVHVGQLQEKWQFPSDHLPIGMSLDETHYASWNVLDTAYINWVIEKDSQGLKRSMVGDENRAVDSSGLTVRDQHVVTLILEMLQHPTHPKHLLALQECGDPFLKELTQRLPSRFTLLSIDGNGVVVDQDHFEILDSTRITHIFSDEPKRSFQQLTLQRKDSKEKVRIINAHLPGDPLKPARFEFARYLAQIDNPDLLTISMGDMNFNETEMRDALNQAFTRRPPTIYSPYRTNISPYTYNSKAIDHFIVRTRNQVHLHSPEQVMPGLSSTAALL